SVPAPTPVQKLPSVRLRREYTPNAELYIPMLMFPRASWPSAVLPPDKALSATSGSSAFPAGERTKQTSMDTMAINVVFRFFISANFRFIFLDFFRRGGKFYGLLSTTCGVKSLHSIRALTF